MAEQNLKQKVAAILLGIDEARMSEILHGKRAISNNSFQSNSFRENRILFCPCPIGGFKPRWWLVRIDKRIPDDNFSTKNLKPISMQQIEPLNYGKFYHIYNKGVNNCDLFFEPTNYEHFLKLYDTYISPVADTYAWVLMKNHFHLLVRIKEKVEIGFLSAAPSVVQNPDGAIEKENPDGGGDKNQDYLHPKTLSGSETAERVKHIPSHQFSHLFNAYAQAYNKRNGRTGSLFIHPFKRKLIEDIEYFKNTVVYIHNNPVHHKFTEHAMDYPWSSYLTCISVKPTHLKRDAVIGWFDNEANFKTAHENPGDVIDLEKWLGL